MKDYDGFPTVVVAGPDRRRTWLYVHGHTPTILRLHRPVVRFLVDALSELAVWFDQPECDRSALWWVLPWDTDYPECVLIASGRRGWLHVLPAEAAPSVVRLNQRIVTFLQQALADLPAVPINQARRAEGHWTDPAATLSEKTLQGNSDSVTAGRSPGRRRSSVANAV